MQTTSVYVSCEDSCEIRVFSLDPSSGELRASQVLTTDGGPQSLFVTADQRVLLAGMSGSETVQAFAIDQASGSLSLLGSSPAPGKPTYVSADRDRGVLFSASYHDNNLGAFPLDASGAPQAGQLVGTELPHAHAVRLDRSERWLLLPLLGADAIRVYEWQGGTQLIPGEPAMVHRAPGSGPRHLVFSQDNLQVYCLNELDGTVDRFDFDPVRGHLTPRQTINILPRDFALKPWAAELRLTPDGRFLYATERSASVIAALSVDGGNGDLVLIDHYPTETQPRGMGIDPSGKWLICVGQRSDRLTLYRVDQTTGRLTARQQLPTGKNPLWVEFALISGD